MRGKKKGKAHNHKHVNKGDKHKSPGVTGYIARNQVTKRLQLNIQEFRKLCILKGIHPVEPGLKRLRKEGNKTWYVLKDVNFMKRDEIYQWYRDTKTYKKKVTYLKAMNKPAELAALRQRKPKLNMDHFVRERYPTFQDAVNDLDDALSMIFLFVEMQHGVIGKSLKKKHFAECARLKSEWLAYVATTHTLRKVFVSIKGIYYQADVLGSTITWLSPHPQRIKVPMTVDVMTMTYFVEFYLTMLNFVFYRLFNDAGYKYPPTIDSNLLSEGQTVKAVTLEKDVPKIPILKNETPAAPSAQPAPLTAAEKARIAIVNSKLAQIVAVDENAKDMELVDVKSEPTDEIANEEKKLKELEEIPEEFRKIDEIEGENKEQYVVKGKIFSGFKFFINREIPKQELRFMIRAFGGEDVTEYDLKETDNSITHQVVDRDLDKSRLKANREYIQPQWIFDSINAGILLPYHEYAHDATLPAHISPFTNDALKGYIPRQREHLDELIEQEKFKNEKGNGVKPMRDGEKDEEEGELRYLGETAMDSEEQSTLEAQYEKELAAEREGVRYDGYVQDALGQTAMYADSDADSSDDDVSEALKKKPKSKKEIQEENRRKEADVLENQQIGLLPRKLRNKVVSIKSRLERRDEQNEALEQKRKDIEKKKKKAAKLAHKSVTPTPPAPTSTNNETNKNNNNKNNNNKNNNKNNNNNKDSNKNNNNKRKEIAVENKPANKKAKK